MKILIIDNNIDRDSWGSPDLQRMARLASGATIHVRRAPQEDLPENPAVFDRIIVSGSRTSVLEDAPWISRLEEFVRRAVSERKPFLGVCYGHQILARVLGGKSAVRRAEQPEFGWSRIEVTGDSPLTRGMPSVFHSYSSHFDEVSRLPSGFRLLARSEICPVQACQLGEQPIFGIQFHPEKELLGARKSLAEQKKSGKVKTFINFDQGEKLYDPKVGETLFRNFFEL